MINTLRTGYSEGELGPIPFRVTITVYPADRNRLEYISGEVPGVGTTTLSELDSALDD